jgi:hypothetical protein
MPGLYKKSLLCFALLLFAHSLLHAQDLLSRRITIYASNQPLCDVLKQISNKGNFYFSYNSKLINRDSIVSISATDQPVQQVLDQLFNQTLSYRVTNNHIILRKASHPPTTTSPTESQDQYFIVSGYILDAETGERIAAASIYDKQHLVSALTDNQGYFTLKLRKRHGRTLLTVSKAAYRDTSLYVSPESHRMVTLVLEPVQLQYSTITVSPVFDQPDSITAAPASISYIPVVQQPVKEVEQTRVGKFLLSAQQRIQSINLAKFFADRPFQVSLIPGIGTQGKLSGQVVNNVSLNLLGGYTGGSEGLELGGLFNINKTRVAGLQAAGIFNIAGGPASGIQMAGVSNTVLNRTKGLQMAGVSNFTKGSFTGWQVSGFYNHATDSVAGAQISGAINFANHDVKGVQISGGINFAKGEVKGAQIAHAINFANRDVKGAQISGAINFGRRTVAGAQISGLMNYARRLKGVQIGLINICDSSSGYSIGLINFVLKGYHKISISANETMDLNLALKSGNSKLYSIMAVSANTRTNEKAYSYGYGFGRECKIGKWFSLNPELVVHHVYLGSYEYGNVWGNLALQCNFKLLKFLTVFAGPSFNAFYSDQPAAMEGYKYQLPGPGYNTFRLWDDRTVGWIGYHVGVAFL